MAQSFGNNHRPRNSGRGAGNDDNLLGQILEQQKRANDLAEQRAAKEDRRQGRSLTAEQLQQELREYYPWTLMKVSEDDNVAREGGINKVINARDWLNSVFERKVREVVTQDMERLGFRQAEEPWAFRLELKRRTEEMLSSTPQTDRDRWEALQRIRSSFVQQVGGAPLEVEPLKTEHWGFVKKMGASNVMSGVAAGAIAIGCQELLVPYFFEGLSILGVSLVNLYVNSHHHERQKNHFMQRVNKLYEDALSKDTFEQKLLCAGALFHIAQQYKFQYLVPWRKDRIDRLQKEQINSIDEGLRELRAAGKNAATKLITQGTSLEGEYGKDQIFEQCLKRFHGYLEAMKDRWADYPDGMMTLARLGVVGAGGYLVWMLNLGWS